MSQARIGNKHRVNLFIKVLHIVDLICTHKAKAKGPHCIFSVFQM